MTLEARLILLAQAIGTDVKTITDNTGDLTTLTTTEQGNIVGSINEIDAEVGVLSTLSTTAKGTVVSSINELEACALRTGAPSGWASLYGVPCWLHW
jgi:hypothetical protein